MTQAPPVFVEGQTLEVNLGPQHPSTHGVFRMIATLDGETIVKLKPVMGYLHRNHEQIGEQMTYIASFPFTDRLDYFNAMSNNFGLDRKSTRLNSSHSQISY